MAVPDTSAYQKLFRLVELARPYQKLFRLAELVRPYQKLFRLAGPAVSIKNFSDWSGQLCLLKTFLIGWSRLSWYLGLEVAKVPIENFLVLQLFTHVKFSLIKYNPKIL